MFPTGTWSSEKTYPDAQACGLKAKPSAFLWLFYTLGGIISIVDSEGLTMRVRRRTWSFLTPPLFALLIGWSSGMHAQNQFRLESQPLSAIESLSLIHIAEGYQVELVAAEPQVMDPVGIDWDDQGRLWVVEMADYPYGIDGQGKPGGRVRYLTDTDGDGLYDRTQLFLDNLSFPTSVMPWKNGVLITAAPDILYAEDTDHDGRADRTEVLYKGFMEGNQQLRVNGLRFGLDGWVYGANGGHHPGFGKDNTITATSSGKTFRLGSRDFRFHPELATIDPLSGPSQYGRVRDDWGNWFGVQNSHPLWHYVFEDSDYRSNPHMTLPEPRRQLRETNARVFINKPIQKRFHSFEQSGRFTSACGPSIYRDRLLFENEVGTTHAFTCEPFHNVVQHHLLMDDGVSFEGRRGESANQKDFFASADRWCRPVLTRTGPDGALYVVDMYRYMIEHPDWLPSEGKEELRPFYRSGETMGRIYRIKPEKPDLSAPRRSWYRLSDSIESLSSRNGRVRDMAQQRIVHSHQIQKAPQIRHLLRNHHYPEVRISALATLAGLDKLSDIDLLEASRDSDSRIRSHAARLLADCAQTNPDALEQLVLMTADRHPRVRFRAAISLSTLSGPTVGQALTDLGKSLSQMDEVATAVMLGAQTHYETFLQHLFSHLSFSKELTRMATRDLIKLPILVQTILNSDKRKNEMLGDLLLELKRENLSLKKLEEVSKSSDMPALLRQLEASISHARRQLGEQPSSSHSATALYRLLGHQNRFYDDDLTLLIRPLISTNEEPLRRMLLQCLEATWTDRTTPKLMTSWARYPQSIRYRITDLILRKARDKRPFIQALEKGSVRPDQLTRSQQLQLLRDRHQEIASLAGKFFEPISTTLSAADKRAALSLGGNRVKGLSIFEDRCLVCHGRTAGEASLGPDVFSLSSRSSTAYLDAILNPNQSVDPRYIGYDIELKDGSEFSGIIRSERGRQLVIQQRDGSERVVPRSSIQSLQGTGLSLMPEGLLEGLSPQEIADLLSFLQTN